MISNRTQILNDRFRQTFVGGRVMMTSGVAAMADDDRRTLLDRVRRFDEFTSENDPYGEHDFGSIDLGGCRYFWKIEYYDPALTSGSSDASDEAATERVLTLMRADESDQQKLKSRLSERIWRFMAILAKYASPTS